MKNRNFVDQNKYGPWSGKLAVFPNRLYFLGVRIEFYVTVANQGIER